MFWGGCPNGQPENKPIEPELGNASGGRKYRCISRQRFFC